ncbi:hypothetical protein F5883DRAFT_668293, partial [Diaporthe sp. PMI_573]
MFIVTRFNCVCNSRSPGLSFGAAMLAVFRLDAFHVGLCFAVFNVFALGPFAAGLLLRPGIFLPLGGGGRLTLRLGRRRPLCRLLALLEESSQEVYDPVLGLGEARAGGLQLLDGGRVERPVLPCRLRLEAPLPRPRRRLVAGLARRRRRVAHLQLAVGPSRREPVVHEAEVHLVQEHEGGLARHDGVEAVQ